MKKEGVVVDSDRRAARIAGRCRLNIVVDLLLLLYNCSLGVSMNMMMCVYIDFRYIFA